LCLDLEAKIHEPARCPADRPALTWAAMYSARFCHETRLLDIRWHGAFRAEEVARYAIELKQQFVREGFRPGYNLRIDMRDCDLQTTAALEAFRHYFAGFPKARRIAVLVSDDGTRQQVTEEMRQSYLRIFQDEAESLHWVLDDDLGLTLA
jgi:hypothetical protein